MARGRDAHIRYADVRRWAAMGLAGVVAGALGVAAGAPVAAVHAAAASSFQSTFDSTMLQLVNQDRAANGVGPLAWNPQLANIAESGGYNGCGFPIGGRAQDLINRNYFAHPILNCGSQNVFNILGADGVPYGYAGENIGWLAGLTDPVAAANDLNNMYMNSPEHRANILNSHYRSVGLGSWVSAPGASWTGGGSAVQNAVISTEEFTDSPGVSGPPAAVDAASVAVTSENGSVWIDWAPPASFGGSPITGYTVTIYQNGTAIGTRTTTGDTGVVVSPLTNGAAYSFTVAAMNASGTGPASGAVGATPTAAPAAGETTAIAPWRALDTRSADPAVNQGHAGRLGAGATMTVRLADGAHVPANATAVLLNLTATAPSANTYLTVYPAGAARPVASNLNVVASGTVANSVEVALGAGQADIFNANGSTDVIVDVTGYVVQGAVAAGAPGLSVAVNPYRACDTRAAVAANECNGAGAGTLGPGTVRKIRITGTGGAAGVPATGVSAIALNVTVTNTAAPGYLTVFPDDGAANPAPPLASTLNWNAGQTLPNHAVVQVPADGLIDVYNASTGPTDVVLDVNAWITAAGSGASGSGYVPLTPARVLDTRTGNGAAGVVNGGSPLSITVAGRGGVPSGATAVVLNVTVTDVLGGGYLTVYPGDLGSAPLISNLNFGTGQTVPNLVVVRLPANGTLNFFNAAGSADVIADVAGYYQ